MGRRCSQRLGVRSEARSSALPECWTCKSQVLADLATRRSSLRRSGFDGCPVSLSTQQKVVAICCHLGSRSDDQGHPEKPQSEAVTFCDQLSSVTLITLLRMKPRVGGDYRVILSPRKSREGRWRVGSDESGTSFVVPQSKTLRVTVPSQQPHQALP
jgi:hypothetical protein